MIIPIIIGTPVLFMILLLYFSPIERYTRELKKINEISSRGLIAMENNDLSSLYDCIDDFASMKLKYHKEKVDLFITIYKGFIYQKPSKPNNDN